MLYHVSIVELKENELNFIPRVPKERMDAENDSIKRICFSDDIANCLKAMSDIEQVLWKSYTNDSNIKLFVYAIDESKLNSSSLLKPINVSTYVPDALENNEYWVLEEVEVNLINTICLDESMYKIFDIDYDEDDRSYNEIILDYLREHKYLYRECLNGELIENIEDDLYW